MKRETVARSFLDGGIVPNENLDTLSDEFINDQIRKARDKLAQDDYDGAITNVRSLVEAFQEEIIRRSGAEVPKYDGDLLKLYKKTTPHFSQSGVRSKIFGVGSGFWLN